MSKIEKKEKNLNLLIDKLNSLTLTYSQPTYELEKIKTEKNEILRQKVEIEKFYIEFSLDMQFLGQTHIIKIPLKDAKPSKNFINKEFENIYFKRFKVKL